MIEKSNLKRIENKNNEHFRIYYLDENYRHLDL